MCTPWGSLTVSPVHDSRRANTDRPLRVQLELHMDREPITGRLRPERGSDQVFVGWLGFVDALKRLHHPDRKEQQ
jgi:hypothetical protein